MMTLDFFSYDVMFAAAIAATVFAALLLVKAFVIRQLRRFAQARGFAFLGYPSQLLDATGYPFMLGVAVLAGVSQLELAPRHDKWLHYAWIVILVSQIALWATRIVSVAVERSFVRYREENPAGATHLMLIGLGARIVVWSLALLITLDNLGFDITTLVASLGIGGIAVALAVQNILGDIFSSVSIALDKPFVIGDFIVVDGFMGTVEYVGMKTTRLRSLGGEQIVFSNAELLKNRIRNYKRMQERRVLFEFGIAYETTQDNVERVPGMVREIIEARSERARFDRAHFKSYGDSALQFEVVYYMLSADYNQYMDLQQEINLELLRRFRQHGITFAYPTRTLHLATMPEPMAAAAPAPERAAA